MGSGRPSQPSKSAKSRVQRESMCMRLPFRLCAYVVVCLRNPAPPDPARRRVCRAKRQEVAHAGTGESWPAREWSWGPADWGALLSLYAQRKGG
eukprot:3099149-Pleurochrysis_carterae.AAC.2